MRARKTEILAEWEIIVQRVSAAAKLDRPLLIDHIPALLDQIANTAEQLAAGLPAAAPIAVAREHARERRSEGYDLSAVVAEYSVLRDCIMRLYFETTDHGDPIGQRALHESIDQAIGESVRRFTEDRGAEAERTLAIIDTILAASQLGIGFIDTSLRYVRVNAALAAVNGRTATAHVGRTVREVIGEAADFIEPLLRRVLETREPVENVELEVAPPSSPDRVRAFTANYVPVITAHGELIGVGAVVIEVTERKQLERELRTRELQFRSVADHMPQLAWIADADGAIHWYNQRWYDYTGQTPQQADGDGWRAVHHADHRDRVAEKFFQHIASGERWEDTFPLRAADGRYRWFLSRAIPIRDPAGRVVQWFGTNTDVSEQRLKHEAALVLSSSLDYDATLPHVAELTVAALGGWCAIDLVEPEGLERIALAPADAGDVTPPGSAVLETGKTEYAGTQIVAPLVARDRTIGAITVASGDSKRRFTPSDADLVEQLGRRIALAVDNARLYEQAQHEARMREEVLAVVSHDLKNPLGAIHLAATLLLGNPEPKQRGHLETIERAASRMDHLIEDLLDMASIQAGRLAIECKAEDADGLVREVVESHAPMAREKGIAIRHDCELQEMSIVADRERILQVFGNLVGNAIKFCGSGDSITITCERRGECAEYRVRDTGPGIPEAELPHIFEPYWSAKRHAKKGTGLGLYISKGIVEAHGGRLRAESSGEGTTFIFTIPLARE